MIVSTKGPNINKKFTMNTSFRPKNMPRNFEKQNSTASVASQRSIYHGRDISPTASVCSDMQPRNFHQPFYQRGYSQRSVYNREGSPVSMRSIDSTASRADIVIDVIQSCTDDEWKKIWHAVNRKHEIRKKKDEKKRRKMKTFLKNLRNRSDDEGEQASHSSISNDDCASTRTGYSQRYGPYWKHNVPRSINSLDCRSEDTYRSNNRDAYRGYARSDSQNPYQAGSINAYHPANMLPSLKQPQFGPTYFSQKNDYSYNGSTIYSSNNTVCGPKNSTFASQRYMNGQANMPSIQRNHLNSSICSAKSMQNMTMMSQRDRFKGGFQFPSQKFNRSTVYEDQVRNKHITNKENNIQRDCIDEQSDENDDIFKDTTAKPKSGAKKTEKRKVENLDDIPNPAKKKPKMAFSNDKPKKLQSKNDNVDNEFEFVKPKFPVRKSAPAKPQEKLISKSSGAPDLLENTQETASLEPDVEPDQSETTQLTTSDMSMRPSFMKRKLFTQTLDVTEKKNNSFNSGTDSPQSNIYSALTREKHKTRKLATSQSLLSRDINQDDDNLLDLIHKIVPPKQVISTITTNITKPNSRVTENRDVDDKWDITSIISTCNNDSISETYTDDEIFKVGNDDKKSKAQEMRKTNDDNLNPKNNKNAKDVVKKTTLPAAPKPETPVKICPGKRVMVSRSRINAFWDTDESDSECASARIQPLHLQDQTRNHITSPKRSSTEPQASSLKMTKTNKPKILNPLVVLQNLDKVIHKQPRKKPVNKTKSEPKTLKKSNNDTSKADKLSKTKKNTPTIAPRTRRQINLSATLQTANSSYLNEKETSVNDTASTKTINKKKQSNEKKATEMKSNKTKLPSELAKIRIKKENDSHRQIKQEHTPRSQRAVKTTKLRVPAEHVKIDICKVLRSRNVDLSSSFNSDKFELTMSRTRKSRTPVK